MIVLRANQELRQTFDKLIVTMKLPVKWNGIFAAVDNYIILQGEVRSLFFHFDSKKVTTNIIDIPVKEDEVQETGENTVVRNVINMILYAFGKWGNLGGLKVEKNYVQLNQLFAGILGEISVEPEYNKDYFRFYKNGIRITYEDVIQIALLHSTQEAEESSGQRGGLWHKMVWKRELIAFAHVETTLSERLRGRLGNNFYLVGFLCPDCGEKLHMVVYPMGKEFRIETEEGGVLLARACTCSRCSSFYTARPKKVLSEGDVYTLRFEDDAAAYEDYLELLGRDGDRVSNYHCNEYADRRADESGEEQEESLEELCAELSELSDLELRKVAARMEEGFYPDESIRKCEQRIKEQRRKRESEAGETNHKEGGKTPPEDVPEGIGNTAFYNGTAGSKVPGKESRQPGKGTAGVKRDTQGSKDAIGGAGGGGLAGVHKREQAGAEVCSDDIIITPAERKEMKEKYDARIAILDRYSERQLKELQGQLERDRQLLPEEKKAYLGAVAKKLYEAQTRQLSKKVDACTGKTYALMKRVQQELDEADLPADLKEPLRAKLTALSEQQAKREVEQLIQKMPPHMDRSGYQQYLKKLKDYDDVDLTPYEEKLKSGQEAAERQEIANVVKRARKISREDYKELAEKLRDGGYLPELVLPYLAKVEERIRQMDIDEIAQICLNPMQMSFDQGLDAYEKIEQGDFLPELKTDALKTLKKRLAKIKTDECELLVKKLRDELEEAGIAENERHHFYPARKVLLHQAPPEETSLIEFAMASYAAGRGPFEYPIFVVDATKNGSGKEGMILTPDHLYYSTMLSAYGISIPAIQRIWASTGLLNRGIYVQQKDGTKIKIPYAVENRELTAFAETLGAFVTYLQEKPDSRNLTYLAKEKHDTICCFRCGYEYSEGTVCPKCGYQNNE